MKDIAMSFTIDGLEFETTNKKMTAAEILRLAGYNSTTHYLVRLDGKSRHSYKDDPLKEIELHKGIEFIAISIEPTPVS